MPPIKEVDLSDGIRIVGSGVPSVWVKEVDFPNISPGEAEKEREMEGVLSEDLQINYEIQTLLSDYPFDDPSRQEPPELLINERIEKIRGKDYLVAVTMYVAVHIFTYSPLKYTVMCQNSRIGPIGGDWWL